MIPRPAAALTPERAFRWACCMDLRALKPGNVSAARPGHGMSGRDFIESARRSAPLLANTAASLGERILAAARATREAVGCNTNLGILLLCGPLLQAAGDRQPGESLAQSLHRQLADAGVQDSEAVFAAIRVASPGGLGDAPRHDVREAATEPLVAVMAEAAHRDRIAAQYAGGFGEVLGPFRAWLENRWHCWQSLSWATSAVYLRYLATAPDSHTLRRQGAATARSVTGQAAELEPRLAAAEDPRILRPELLALDRKLRAGGINPGTCADLTVATVCAALLEPAPENSGAMQPASAGKVGAS